MGVHRNHRAGDHQHQHHVGLGLPIGGQQVDHEQRGLRQHGGDRQVARAEAHAIAQVDPDHHRVDRQRPLATHHQAVAGAGVVVDHAQDAPRRVVPGPAGNGHAQEDRTQHEQGNVDHHRHIGLNLLPRQKPDHAKPEQGATGDDDPQGGLVEFAVLLNFHAITSLCNRRCRGLLPPCKTAYRTRPAGKYNAARQVSMGAGLDVSRSFTT